MLVMCAFAFTGVNFKPSISDEAVLQATGRSWREWFGLMESAGMGDLSHSEIVSVLRDEHGVPSWWQQSIADAFERFIGRRPATGTEDGFHASVTCTVDLPAETVYRMWADDGARGTWLRKRDFEVTMRDPGRAVSGTWSRDGSDLEVSIEEIEEGRCRITILHRKLADVETVETMRKFWKMAVGRLVGKAK